MKNIVKEDIDIWVRPWDKPYTDNIYDRDDRFLAILVKGVLAYLNRTIILNGKNVKHFIFNTGSTYLYLEKNGYEFTLCETSGEDNIYMHLPCCVINLDNLSVPTDELTNSFVRGTYERISSLSNKIETYSSEIKRIPIELNITLAYYLSTNNEGLILMEEFLSKLIFQKYFNIVYLGQKIMCSIEFPTDIKLEFNKPDLASADPKHRTINLSIKVCSNYPLINLNTEIKGDKTIQSFASGTFIENNERDVLDYESRNLV